MRSGHHSTEYFATAWIAAQEFDEVSFDPVEDHESGKNLSIKLLALEQPHQQHKIEELGGGFDQLRRFQSFVKWRARPTASQRVGEDDSPEMIGGLAVAAAGRETAKAAEHVSKGEPGSEGVAGPQRWHVPPSYIPRSHEQRADQTTRKNSSGLQCVEAENLTPVTGICIPFIDDQKDFCAQNPGQNDENPKVPGVIAIDALLFGIANTDPESDQYTRGDQQAISRQAKVANVKESGKHVRLDAPVGFSVQREV